MEEYVLSYDRHTYCGSISIIITIAYELIRESIVNVSCRLLRSLVYIELGRK